MELNAQTVKWFKLPDEQLDPLMSLGALTLSVKHRFHCCRLFAASPCNCVHVRVRVSVATGPICGLEMVVVLVVLMVWMGSYLDGWKKDWRDGWMEGREAGRGGLPLGTHQKKTEWGKQEERKKRRTLPILLFFSPRPVWQQLRPAYCCCFLAEQIFEPWATLCLSLSAYFSPSPFPPSLLFPLTP